MSSCQARRFWRRVSWPDEGGQRLQPQYRNGPRRLASSSRAARPHWSPVEPAGPGDRRHEVGITPLYRDASICRVVVWSAEPIGAVSRASPASTAGASQARARCRPTCQPDHGRRSTPRHRPGRQPGRQQVGGPQEGLTTADDSSSGRFPGAPARGPRPGFAAEGPPAATSRSRAKEGGQQRMTQPSQALVGAPDPDLSLLLWQSDSPGGRGAGLEPTGSERKPHVAILLARWIWPLQSEPVTLCCRSQGPRAPGNLRAENVDGQAPHDRLPAPSQRQCSLKGLAGQASHARQRLRRTSSRMPPDTLRASPHHEAHDRHRTSSVVAGPRSSCLPPGHDRPPGRPGWRRFLRSASTNNSSRGRPEAGGSRPSRSAATLAPVVIAAALPRLSG